MTLAFVLAFGVALRPWHGNTQRTYLGTLMKGTDMDTLFAV